MSRFFGKVRKGVSSIFRSPTALPQDDVTQLEEFLQLINCGREQIDDFRIKLKRAERQIEALKRHISNLQFRSFQLAHNAHEHAEWVVVLLIGMIQFARWGAHFEQVAYWYDSSIEGRYQVVASKMASQSSIMIFCILFLVPLTGRYNAWRISIVIGLLAMLAYFDDFVPMPGFSELGQMSIDVASIWYIKTVSQSNNFARNICVAGAIGATNIWIMAIAFTPLYELLDNKTVPCFDEPLCDELKYYDYDLGLTICIIIAAVAVIFLPSREKMESIKNPISLIDLQQETYPEDPDTEVITISQQAAHGAGADNSSFYPAMGEHVPEISHDHPPIITINEDHRAFQSEVSLISRYHESIAELQKQASRIILILAIFLIISAAANGYVNFVWNISGTQWLWVSDSNNPQFIPQYGFALGVTTSITLALLACFFGNHKTAALLLLTVFVGTAYIYCDVKKRVLSIDAVLLGAACAVTSVFLQVPLTIIISINIVPLFLLVRGVQSVCTILMLVFVNPRSSFLTSTWAIINIAAVVATIIATVVLPVVAASIVRKYQKYQSQQQAPSEQPVTPGEVP